MAKVISPSQSLKAFKTVLKDAAKAFSRAPVDVNIDQFFMVSSGRFTQREMNVLGGYTRLKKWAAGEKSSVGQIEALVKALKGLGE